MPLANFGIEIDLSTDRIEWKTGKWKEQNVRGKNWQITWAHIEGECRKNNFGIEIVHGQTSKFQSWCQIDNKCNISNLIKKVDLNEKVKN